MHIRSAGRLIGKRLLPFLLVAAGVATPVSPGWSRATPNVIVIVTDDVGIGDLRPYNAESRLSLPSIEQLAEEGIVFTDAHTSAAKCAPSRYSIVTGNYHWRGLKAWGQWDYRGGSQIKPGQRTLGDLFKRAGYATAFIGKYHLGGDLYKIGSETFVPGGSWEGGIDFGRPMRNGPREKGFDYSFLALRGIQQSPYAFFENDLLAGSPGQLVNWSVGDYGDTRIDSAGIGLPDWNTRSVGPTLLSKAVSFIEAHRGTSSAPFFVYLNTQSAHTPFKPPVELGGRPVLGSSGLSSRGDMLVEIDAMVGELRRTLDRHGILDDTILVFASDNGGISLYEERRQGHLTSAYLRGDKGTVYEGGHRVPLIIRWRDGFPATAPGTRLGALVGIQDLYATLAGIIGVTLGDDEALDSISFLGVLSGDSTAARTSMANEADEPEDGAADGISGNHFAYRAGQWKLVMDSAGTPVGLYNLDGDVGENSNLVHSENSLAAQLLAEFKTLRSSSRTRTLGSGSSPPPSETPVVTARLDAEGTAVPLTSLGTADWVHWGLSAASSVNRKAGVVARIGALAPLGGALARFQAPSGVRPSYAWADGTPNTSVSTTAGVYVSSPGGGFELAVPADTTARTLMIWLGGYRSRGRIEVSLSDGSAAPYITTLENLAGVYDRRLTVHYRAGSAGQSLAVRYVKETGSNVTFQAAALQEDGGGPLD